VFRSRANIYAQIIDDESGKTLALGLVDGERLQVADEVRRQTRRGETRRQMIAERAVAAGIKEVRVRPR
jgi:ribosomal protein L18